MEMKSPFKISLIFLLATLPASVALADPDPCRLCNFNGFTVGVGAGATTFMTNTSSNAMVLSDKPIFFVPNLAPDESTLSDHAMTNSASSNPHRYGGMGAIFIGYGRELPYSTYIGAELGLNFLGSTQTSLTANNANQSIVTYTDSGLNIFNEVLNINSLNSRSTVARNSVEPFLDLKLGFLMTPTAIAYLRGGINYNKIKVKTMSDYSSNSSLEIFGDDISSFPHNASGNASVTSASSKSRIGYRAGVGMEVLITPQIGVGADYIYTWYPNVTTNGSGTGTDAYCDALEGCQVVGADITQHGTSKVADQQIMAQLIYHIS